MNKSTPTMAHQIAQGAIAFEQRRLGVPEEFLVADPRCSLTPAQIVDQKLLVLLRSCAKSLQPVDQDPRKWAQNLG